MVNKTTELLRAIQASGLVTRDARDAQQLLTEIHQRSDGGVVHRAAEVVKIDEESRTVELAFSSDTDTVRRWYGVEILSHDPAHVRLGRLNDGGALLWNHNWDDQRGVVEAARIDADNKGRATIRFGTSEAAEELWQDVKNKIKRHVSVGYFVHAIQLLEIVDDMERWLITDWEPYEISIVSVPADTTVGIGRSAEILQVDRNAPVPETGTLSNNPEQTPGNRTNTTMEKILRNAAGDLVRATVDEQGNIIAVLETLEKASDAQRALQNQGAAAERTRVSEITALVERFARGVPKSAELGSAAIKDGRSVDEFRQQLLDAVDTRFATPLPEQNLDAGIGLSEREISQYSIMNVVRSLAEPGNARLREAAALEFRASEAAVDALGRNGERFVIPPEVLSRAVGTPYGRAAMTTNVTGPMNGGQLVDTQLQTGSFIDLLRNNTVALRLGRVLGGLTGNIDIPKKLSGGTGYWIGEGQDAKETGMSLGQLSFKPKTVSAYSDVTHRALMQSSMDLEALLRADLAESLGLTIDTAAWYGTGTEYQPLGIMMHDGINGQPFVGDYPTYAEAVAMETAVAVDNALVQNMKFVGAPGFRGYAKTTPRFGAGTESTIWEPGNTVNGYPVEITNQVSATDVLFGNFSDFIIAMWGGLEIDVDTTTLRKSRGVRVLAFQDIDFGLRRLESFVLGRKA